MHRLCLREPEFCLKPEGCEHCQRTRSSCARFIKGMRTGLRDTGSKLLSKLRLQPSNPQLSSQEAADHSFGHFENRITNIEEEHAKILSAVQKNGQSVEEIVADNVKVLSETAILKRRINKTNETVSKLLGKNKDLRTVIGSLKTELNSYIDMAQRNQVRIGVLEQDIARFCASMEEKPVSAGSTENEGNDHLRTPTTTEECDATEQNEATASEGMVIQNRWKLGKKLGLGSGGLVCEALDMLHQKNRAAKLEFNQVAKKSTLLRGFRVYEILHRQNGLSGFSRVHFSGPCGPFNALILDLLGPSLIEFCQPRIPMHSVFGVGVQCLDRIRVLHQHNIIHRDIKPENILVNLGPNGNGVVHLIDFGLATSCNTSAVSPPRPLTRDLPFIGTGNYAPIAAHKGIAQERRDDLEALGYVLIKLINGRLPWENLRGANLEDLSEKTLQLKQSISLATLCQGLPAELLVFLRHVQNLSFAERPDYEGLRFLLLNAQK